MTMLSPADRRQLDELGYLVIPDFVPATMLDEMRERVEALWAAEGDDAGTEFRLEPGTRRLANLVDKGDVFTRMIVMPGILECVEAVIGPDYKLSSLNARSTNPHNPEAQPWHVDAGAIADERGYWVCNTIWMLDDFTPDNGATRMIPRSHTWGRLPAPGNRDTLPDEQLVTGRSGTVVVMNTHMWHAGHRKPHRPVPPRAARLLHAQRQAAAAIPEGAAASADDLRALAGAAQGSRPRRSRE
jgi:hypothetical protein